MKVLTLILKIPLRKQPSICPVLCSSRGCRLDSDNFSCNCLKFLFIHNHIELLAFLSNCYVWQRRFWGRPMRGPPPMLSKSSALFSPWEATVKIEAPWDSDPHESWQKLNDSIESRWSPTETRLENKTLSPLCSATLNCLINVLSFSSFYSSKSRL